MIKDCIWVDTDPARRAADAKWLRGMRAAGHTVLLPPKCENKYCPRHGTEKLPPADGLRCFEGVGYTVLTAESKRIFGERV